MDTTLADPLVGRLLDGRYQVEALIARGGMATVYLATDTRLERRVALKVMHPDLARDTEFVDRFIGEAKSVARLSHPNIVSVFDQGSDGYYPYLAMEYLPGRTLRDLLEERGAFPAHEALGIMLPLLSGLAAAHAAGIVHRDVKPENVLIAPDGHLKVVDFGLARGLTVSNQTRTGVIIGTVAYLAPEQVTGTGADPRTDVYAAGIVLYELLTGTKPHSGESPLAVAYKHVNEQVPAPSRLVPGLPVEIDQLVMMATNRDPRGRPADASELIRAVEHVMRGMPPGPLRGPSAFLAEPYTAPMATQSAGRTGQDGHTQMLGDGRPAVTGARPGYQPTGYEEYGDYGRGGRRRGRVTLLVVLALAIFVLAGAGGWWLTQGRYAKVPSVAGMTDAAALGTLRSDGFRVTIGTSVTSNSARLGTVVRTVPGAGGRVTKGSEITLVPSAGPQKIKIPSVTGQQVAQAQAALRGAGLTPGQVKQVASGSASAGTVVGTQPGAGTVWPANQPVAIQVSAGPPLPDFVGQNEQTIQQWAAQNGITLNVQQDAASSQPQGTITRQSPAAGTPITSNETVTIGVSNGPPQVAVPNVDGMSIAQARQTLRQAGFKVTIDRFTPFGQVFDYSPSGQAPKGSTITIYAGL